MGPGVSHFGAFKKNRGRAAELGHKVRRTWAGAVLTTGVLLAVAAWGEPILHELFTPDPAEDLRLGATTSSGVMPASMQTKSGWVSAPDPVERAGQAEDQTAYGGPSASAENQSEFVLDNHTTRPERVQYDEPFRPSILPYKRLSAFDAISSHLSLTVLDPRLVELDVGGSVATTEDAFYGDFEVDLVAQVPVRIPTVGPGARLLSLQVDPPRAVTVLHDGADNWFVTAKEGGRVRMFVHLSIERETFGSQFLPVGRVALGAYVPEVPETVKQVAAEVMLEIPGLSGVSPAGAVAALVAYFRTFKESSDLPQATDALALYKEISLSKKGVCRHRAYAFVVTALSWGIPARLVHNEAHAWVEVFDSKLWHRIDLGGAASDLIASRDDPLVVRHRAPSDPFTWPASERPASLEFERRLAQGRSAPRDSTHATSSSSGNGAGLDGTRPLPNASSTGAPGKLLGTPSGAQTAPAQSAVSSATNNGAEPGVVLQLRVEGSTYLRGTPLLVSGSAFQAGQACALSRVDIDVALPEGWTTLGSLATDRNGQFQGAVTLPHSLPVGSLSLAARLGSGCGKP
jgi:hypothetical protein